MNKDDGPSLDEASRLAECDEALAAGRYLRR